MIRRDYHVHTDRCDGHSPAEETILRAIEMGMEEIGFSEHSHTPCDESYCLSHDETREYIEELKALREKYKDRISVKIGLEMDLESDGDSSMLDYCIGSVHYVKVPEETEGLDCSGLDRRLAKSFIRYEGFIYIPVDESIEIQKAAIDRFFGGDPLAFGEAYFEAVGTVAEKTCCSIIGHFDLITKFNEKEILFDEEDPRYIAAWKGAVDRLIPYGIPFEINTGAISRGYRTGPYPAEPIRRYIREKGGSFILSSDSHRADTLCYMFESYESEVD